MNNTQLIQKIEGLERVSYNGNHETEYKLPEETKQAILTLLQKREDEVKSEEEAFKSYWENIPAADIFRQFPTFQAGCAHARSQISAQIESLARLLEEKEAKEKADLRMLREYSMRLGIALPENEEDVEWSDKGMEGKKTGYLILWLFEKLGLGKEDEQIMPEKVSEKYQRIPMGDILKKIEASNSKDRLNNRKTREG